MISLNATTESRDRWKHRLFQMRGAGSRRARKGMPSASLLPLLNQLPDDAVVVDLGCGESGDYFIARQNGLRSFRLDLFPPSSAEHFVQADVLKLPFANESVDGFFNHAVISLIAPFDRWTFYEEVVRVLKPNGLLSVTPYNLSDGFSVQVAIEDGKAFDKGLHKVRRGLYRKCSDQKCNEHPASGSLEAIQRAVDAIDIDPIFRHIALIFLGWFTNDWSVPKAAEFTGKTKDEVKKVVRGLISCGIYDPEKRTLDLPWFDYYIEDKIADGNIALVLDVLAIEGKIERYRNDEGELMFKAKDEQQETETVAHQATT